MWETQVKVEQWTQEHSCVTHTHIPFDPATKALSQSGESRTFVNAFTPLCALQSKGIAEYIKPGCQGHLKKDIPSEIPWISHKKLCLIF